MIKLIDELDLLLRKIASTEKSTHGLSRALRGLKKETVLYRNHCATLKNGIPKIQDKKVQIGGGRHTLKGFLNIDIIPPADLIWDVREGIPLKSNSVEFIFCEHFLEHLDYPVSVKKLVKESFRVLKPGGSIVVGVPDSEIVIKKYIKKDKMFFQEIIDRWYSKRDCLEHFNTYIDLINYHFRDQDDSDKYNPHLWAYDFEKLKSLFKSVGFETVNKWCFDSELANPKRKWGSIYVVAKKDF